MDRPDTKRHRTGTENENKKEKKDAYNETEKRKEGFYPG